MDKIKLGIIGVGNMGKNHVRLAREHEAYIDFAGVFDPDKERVKKMELEDIAYDSEQELMEAVDAVIVAAPSSMHKKLGLMAAENGCHLLVEKPLALSYEDGKDLVEAFERTGKVLMVGHVERFNPVVTELEKVIKNEKIVAIETDRCSPMDRRISDTDVIYDLMIHDVDILINSIVPNAEIDHLHAVGTTSYSEHFKDYVQAVFRFDNGAVGSVVSSRATEGKIRSIRVHCDKACIEADLLHKSMEISRKTRYSLDVGYDPTYKQENIKEEIFVPNVESLKTEQLHFFECIRDNKMSKTSGVSALRSLKVLDAIKSEVYQ